LGTKLSSFPYPRIGTTYEHEVQDYPGLASHPIAREDAVDKFDRLVADRIDDDLSREIKEAVRRLYASTMTDADSSRC
jgi:2-methylcitrate dehydratase